MKLLFKRFYNELNLNNFGEYYTYLLSNPLTKEPFYVGKGKGRRCFYHLKEKLGPSTNLRKHYKIRQILSSGLQPEISRVVQGVSEEIAYSIEQGIMRCFGTLREGTGPLCNLMLSGFNRRYDKSIPENLTIYQKISIKQKANWANPLSIYNDPIYRAKFFNQKGERNNRYGDHRSYEELHGLEKARLIRENQSKKRRGSGNGRAKYWKLTSPTGEEFLVHGGLKKFCLDNGLLLSALRKSGKSNLPVKDYLIQRKRHPLFLNTIGWQLYEI